MNMKDLEESTRARLVESAARIVGHTMEMKQESLSVLLLRDFAETPTIATTSPSLIQALHKESDPKRLRVRLALLAVFLQKLKQPKLCVAVLSTNSTWNVVLRSLRHKSQDVVEGSCKLVTAALRSCCEHIVTNELRHIGKEIIDAMRCLPRGCVVRVVTSMFEIHARSSDEDDDERSKVSREVAKNTIRIVTAAMNERSSLIPELLPPLLALMCCMDTTCPKMLYCGVRV